MTEEDQLKDKYSLSKCCYPKQGDEIVGYFSHDDHIKIHRADCGNLEKTEQARLIHLEWREVLADRSTTPDSDYDQLDETDFAVLRHHKVNGIDYSLLVARILSIDKQEAFDRHKKLRDMKLLERVDALMVQYRKGIVDNKWIKHRNHTYYRITDKGDTYLDFYRTTTQE